MGALLPTPELLLGTLVRFLWLAGIALAVGAVAIRVLVLRRVTIPTWPGAERTLAARAAQVGEVAALLALAAVAGRLVAQIGTVAAPDAPADAELVQRLVWQTRWGRLWLLDAALAIAAWRAFALARRDLRAAWLLAGLAAAALALTTALGSHAAGTALAPLTIAADALHVLAAGGWAGGLAILFAIALWPRAADRASGDDAAIAAAVPRLVRAFTPFALTAAGTLAATGVFAALVQLAGAPGGLGAAASWRAPWTLMLAVKVALALGAAALGALNWRRLAPALGTPEADARLRVSVWAELTLMALALLATAVLVALPLPGAA